MNFRGHKRRNREVEISLVPLIDLFLNILVFFLVTTSFAESKFFSLSLPESESGAVSEQKDPFTVFISSDGEIALEDQKISVDELKTYFNELSESQKKAGAFVKADKNASHGAVIEVLDQLRVSGVTNIGMFTQAKQQ